MALNVKEWRLIKEKTIEQMADLCGVHWNTYKYWEEHPESIKVSNALKISKALDIPIDSIVFAKESTESRVASEGNPHKEE